MNEQLKNETKKGIFWSAVQRFSIQGGQFIIGIVLANFLKPSDYGTIGMLSIFIAISSVFIDGGFINALTRKQDRTQADICTVFYFNIIISVLSYCILFLIAPLVALFYNMPELCLVLRIFGISLIINSFSAVQATLLTIKLDFKTQTKVSIISLTISSIIAIILAYKGYNYWALVVQAILSSTLSTTLFWYYSTWRPSLIFSKKSFKELFGFGSKLLIQGLIDNIYNNIYPLVIGKTFSASALGNYNRADSYAKFPSSSLTGVMQRVTYPVLCRMQNNEAELAEAYRKFLKLSTFIIFPLMTGLSALSYPFIILVIGHEWEDCVSMLQILCFALMWYPVHAINLNLLLVKGRSDLSLKLEVIKKIIGIAVLCIAVPFGIMVLCWSIILTSIISLFINTYYTGKLIGLGIIRQLIDISPSLIISLTMWCVVMLTNIFISNSLAQLFVGMVIGALFYIIASFIFNRNEFNSVLSLIHK